IDRAIHLRRHRRAEPPRDSGAPRIRRTVGGRDRAAAAAAAARGVETSSRAARRRLSGVHRGRTTSFVPAETRTARGAGCVAGAVPPLLVRSPRRARAPPRPHGSTTTNQEENKE